MIQVNSGHRASCGRAGNSRTPANDKHAPRPLLPFPPRHLSSHRRVRDRCHGSVIAATAKASALTSAPLCVVERSVYSGGNLYGRRPMNRIRVDLGMLDRFRAITCPALKSLLFGLAHHRCSYGEAGGDETPRLGGNEPVPGLGLVPPASSTSISPSAVVSGGCSPQSAIVPIVSESGSTKTRRFASRVVSRGLSAAAA